MTKEELDKLKPGDLIKPKEYNYKIEVVAIKDRGIVGVLHKDKTHKHFTDWNCLLEDFDLVQSVN